MNHFQNKNIFGTILIISLTISVLFAMLASQKPKKLEVYNESDVISTEEETTEKVPIETFLYSNETYGFQVSIPTDWKKINEDNCDTFIHTASASSIQIQIIPYNASINNITADYISTEIIEQGFSFLNFSRLSESSYEVLYQKIQSNTYDYIEEVFWSKDVIIKLVCTFNDNNYHKIYPYYAAIFDSFTWNTERTIPSGYYLYYEPQTDFEFGIPVDWTVSSAGNSIVAMNPDGTAQMTVQVQENPMTLENMTATDMTKLLLPGKSNFMLKEFNTTYTNAYALANYNNGNNMINQSYFFTNGIYLYWIQFDYIAGSIDDSIPDTCAGLFREFITKKMIQESEIATPSDADISNN